MGLQALVDLIHSGDESDWYSRNESALDALFGSPDGRYREKARTEITLRAPGMSSESGVPFAAYIHPSNQQKGAYSGMSFVLFPSKGKPCLFGLVIGTAGLSPDEAILGRPGHVRKVRAICDWLNAKYGRVAWSKQDPTRTDIKIPSGIKNEWADYKPALDRYGDVVYGLYRPTEDRTATETALAAFLDLMFEERGQPPIAGAAAGAAQIKAAWFEHLMPPVTKSSVASLLADRRYAILQGPPGTGKTRMALDLLANEYAGNGRSIQFHPNITYENFVGGLAPMNDGSQLGLRFAPAPGFLMQAAIDALKDPSRPFLLHIDEINRADLSKVLGEAIFLFEHSSDFRRTIELAHDFGPPFHRKLVLPANLHVLGTMNSADRSIAILDVAVRRRFAFVSLWPSMAVVEQHGGEWMQKAYSDLLSIFVEHAGDDTFALVPGHSYFLEKDDDRAKQSLQVNLAPLLEEYLAQGYVSGFAEPMRSYLQWLHAE